MTEVRGGPDAVLTSLADPTLRDIVATVRGSGGRRVARIAARYAEGRSS